MSEDDLPDLRAVLDFGDFPPEMAHLFAGLVPFGTKPIGVVVSTPNELRISFEAADGTQGEQVFVLTSSVLWPQPYQKGQKR